MNGENKYPVSKLFFNFFTVNISKKMYSLNTEIYFHLFLFASCLKFIEKEIKQFVSNIQECVFYHDKYLTKISLFGAPLLSTVLYKC